MPVLEFNMTEETKSHLHLQSQSAAQTAPCQRRSTGLCHRREPLRKEQTALQVFFQISTKARKLNNLLKYEMVFFFNVTFFRELGTIIPGYEWKK